VKQQIMRLRQKFQDDAKYPMWFANVPGVGYRFIGGQTSGRGWSNGFAPMNSKHKAA
jgi:DNA-binding winged helix-turn-helix (wHTH) protein